MPGDSQIRRFARGRGEPGGPAFAREKREAREEGEESLELIRLRFSAPLGAPCL